MENWGSYVIVIRKFNLHHCAAASDHNLSNGDSSVTENFVVEYEQSWS
jgi:hypothetical protein